MIFYANIRHCTRRGPTSWYTYKIVTNHQIVNKVSIRHRADHNYNSAPMDAKPTHMAGIKMPALATAAQRFRFTHLSGSSRVIGGSIGRLPDDEEAGGTACLRKCEA